MQLDLFDNADISLLKEEVIKVKTSSDNVRRGLFARHNELCKMFLEQKKELDELKITLFEIKDLLYGDEEKVIELRKI